MAFPLLWAQVAAPPPAAPPVYLQWLYTYGEPTITIDGPWGGPLVWLKVIAIIALICWVVSWLQAGFKEGIVRGPLVAIPLVVAIFTGLSGIVLGTMAGAGQVPDWTVRGQPLPVLLGISGAVFFVLWIEAVIWPSALKLGRPLDVLTLVGIHLALPVGFYVARGMPAFLVAGLPLVGGARLALTYMGFVVLARVVGLFLGELFAVRARRMRAMSHHTILESTRRMGAPWVVLVVFVVVLAFTHWFLTPPPAEMGRMYVGTLMLLISLILTVMIVLLAPLSLPTDIQNQTIYTVVTKPVRRLELVWGRLLGYMVLATLLLVAFGTISGLYVWRQVDNQIKETETALKKAAESNQTERRQMYEDTLAQLKARRSARRPVKGSLLFYDSIGAAKPKGIDVGQELEYRSFIEGATPSRALWRFGRVMDPFDEIFPDPNRIALPPIDRRINVDDLLKRDTIEWYDNEAAERSYRVRELDQKRQSGQLSPQEAARGTNLRQQLEQELANFKNRAEALRKQERDLRDQARDLEAENAPRAAEIRRDSKLRFHSPDVKLQMTFNVYRTTKGVLGEPVFASIRVLDFQDEDRRLAYDVIPIREYYTNTWEFPASALVGSRGFLKVEVKCISPTQYLGMAESDLYILADSGNFWVNYAKGMSGVWLQVLVLAAVGVFAGTFLNWRVALLFTLFFFVFGQLAYSLLQGIAMQSMLGGGPVESFIRMLGHSNQMADLAPTTPVIIAKTIDSMVMPILSRLVYVIPNLPALDVSTKVADGFAVEWSDLRDKLGLALGYALPFSIAGYFILKQREVAA